MMIMLGAVIVLGVIWLLLKRHESRMVLIAAGILMCCLGGKPMAALDAFAKSMTNAGLITSVCSCMGFAWCMKYTGCDKHLVVAIGKPKFINETHISEGVTIVDVGINITENGICGDVDFDRVKDKCYAITPVPGGVGPMTVYSLIENLINQ